MYCAFMDKIHKKCYNLTNIIRMKCGNSSIQILRFSIIMLFLPVEKKKDLIMFFCKRNHKKIKQKTFKSISKTKFVSIMYVGKLI